MIADEIVSVILCFEQKSHGKKLTATAQVTFQSRWCHRFLAHAYVLYVRIMYVPPHIIIIIGKDFIAIW